MTNDHTDRAAIKLVGNGVHVNGGPARDLRLEVLNLRGQLEEQKAAATRHAVMLREGDHRIKNSLQLIGSLMNLQARREPEGPIQDALHAAAARIGSVAAIHDALQGSRGLGHVDLAATLRQTCTALQAIAGDEERIQVIVEAEPLELPVASAQPLVLAVNELVVNALRHAFTDQERGQVHVTLVAGAADLTLTVTDDGKGLPANHASAHGFGMALVAMMTRQVHGRLATRTGPGTAFTITVPLPVLAPTH